MIKYTLDTYLTELEEYEQKQDAADRRHIPTIAELALATKTTRQNIYNIRNNNVTIARFDMLDLILRTFRAKGFDTKITDLIREV